MKDTSVINHSPAMPFTVTEVWSTLVEEAEQRGFAKGYAIGVQEAQRATYTDGRNSVINKLMGLLS